MGMPTDADLIEMLSSITKQQTARIEQQDRKIEELFELVEILSDGFEENAKKNKEWINYFNTRIIGV